MYTFLQITNPVVGTTEGWTGLQFFQSLIPAAVTLGFVIAAIVFVFIFLIGAIQWITAGGDKAQHENAKSKLTNALVGLFILLGILVIVKFVEAFFGISITLIDIESLQI